MCTLRRQGEDYCLYRRPGGDQENPCARAATAATAVDGQIRVTGGALATAGWFVW